MVQRVSKYHNESTIIDGIRFDSKKEAQRYRELKLLERVGIIKNLALQVPFVLIEKSKYGRAIKYIADFVYDEDGHRVVEDVKGFRTDIYKIKKRLFEEKYGFEITEI